MTPGLIFVLLTLFALPSTAYAHAFGARYDLPLPLIFYLSAAGIAVAASFLAAFLFIRPGRLRTFKIAIPINQTLSVLLSRLSQALGLIVLACILITALVGDPSPTKNLATVTVWVWWWVGFTLFSALFVNLWPWLNPFRTTALLALKILMKYKTFSTWQKNKEPPLPSLAPYLAVIGLFILSWIELVSDISETPNQLFWLIILYLVITCACACRYGVDQWFSRADPLTCLFKMMGRAAPLSLTPSSGVFIRLPGSGLGQQTEIGTASTLFILMLISIVLFDGLSETPLWQSVQNFVAQSQTLRPVLLDLQSNGLDILKSLKTFGLLFVFLLACISYWLLAFLIWLAVRRQIPFVLIVCRFAPSLLPIAIAYHLAHYVSYFMLAGQLILPILSDPFALGWDLFGTSVQRIDLSVINAEDVWWIAIITIIVGHVISVFVAHVEAIKLCTTRGQAVRSQIPMMIFMVLLTMCSLWILSQPIVT